MRQVADIPAAQVEQRRTAAHAARRAEDIEDTPMAAAATSPSSGQRDAQGGRRSAIYTSASTAAMTHMLFLAKTTRPKRRRLQKC
jgi:hypothetical protein